MGSDFEKQVDDYFKQMEHYSAQGLTGMMQYALNGVGLALTACTALEQRFIEMKNKNAEGLKMLEEIRNELKKGVKHESTD